MSTHLDYARLSLKNQTALACHQIDCIVRDMNDLPDGIELSELALDAAADAMGTLLIYTCNALENGVVTLAELAFKDPLADVGVTLRDLESPGDFNATYPYDHPED